MCRVEYGVAVELEPFGFMVHQEAVDVEAGVRESDPHSVLDELVGVGVVPVHFELVQFIAI